MASEITNYQCPACTAPLHFSEKTGKLECDYCGSSYTVEEAEALYQQKNEAAAEEELPLPEQGPLWDMEDAGSDWGKDAGSMRAYSCPSCGAELICEETTAATSCPYCGNPTIIPGQFSGLKKPDVILPFKLDKNAAMDALKRHYQRKPLLPSSFASDNHIQEIKGVYVPFWLFDADVEADMTFDATRSFTHTTSKEYITETDHFLVRRRGTVKFTRVPVDGASKMPDGHMDAIEPFDYRELKPFSLSYLPGFLADKYDMDSNQCVQRADNRCRNSAVEAMRNTVLGYQTCVAVKQDCVIHPKGVEYALLPVWMLSTQWNGKNYLFAMNGQTGKLIGDLPVDRKKLAAWCAGVFAAVSAVVIPLLLL